MPSFELERRPLGQRSRQLSKMEEQIHEADQANQSSQWEKRTTTRLSLQAAADAIIAVHRMNSTTNFADDSWYINFFCSEISVSQLSMFHELFLQKTSKESPTVNREAFHHCVLPILNHDQKQGFGGKRFQVLFDKIDANKDGLVSWDDISMFILQGSGAHQGPLISDSSSQFFVKNDNRAKLQQASRKCHHKDVISSMHVVAHLEVLVTSGHDGCIGVWKLKDLDMLQMIQVCPSNSTWISGMTDIAWADGQNGHATMLCLVTSAMKLYYAKVDEITSAFAAAVPESACPCVYTFPANQSATCIKGFRIFHEESDSTISSGAGQKPFDDVLAVGFENGDIRIMHARVDRMRPSEQFKMQTHTSKIAALIWIAEMSTLVAASHDSKISMHTFNMSRDGISETKMFTAHSKAVDAIVFSSRDAVVASCGLERDILVWSPFTTQLLARLIGHNSSVFSLVVDPLSSTLVSLGSDRQVYVWSLTNFQYICKQDLASKLHAVVDIKSIVIEGSTMFWGTNVPIAWQISHSLIPDSKITRTTSHTSPVIAFLQSDHFEQFITVHADGQAATWAMANGSEITSFPVCPASTVMVNCAILDPKQRRLFVGTDDGIIRTYNIFNGQILHELMRSLSSKACSSRAKNAEVCSMCFVYRQMRILLAATFSDTSSVSFWPEYPSNYVMSAVFNLDIRGHFGINTPEQIGFLLHENVSSSSNCFPILMANGKLATVSIDSGHTLAEFSVAPTAASAGLEKLDIEKRADHQTTFSLDNSKEDQTLIRMFVLAHKKNYLIAIESENRFHTWDFARNMFKKTFHVPNRDSKHSCILTCMDLSYDDGLFCLGDSHGWIHTYVHPFSTQTYSKRPSFSFCALTEGVTILKFVGNLDIIVCSGSELITRLWRPDGKHFLHTNRESASSHCNFSAPLEQSDLALSSSLMLPLNSLGALSCSPWKYESLLLAQGNFLREPKSKMKDAVQVLSRMNALVRTNISMKEQEKEPNLSQSQFMLKSLKLRAPATPQEERDQARMLIALATPRRGSAAIPNSLPQLHSLRGPHSKIVIHPIAPDPYLNPIKTYGSVTNILLKRDPTRAFLPKDSFKESILRQEEQGLLRATEASPLLKRSLRLVRFEP